ncbi:MAG: HNH endonuclease [Pseudomonadota bacterium]
MPRTVPEWIAKHDDQAVPPHVRARVFDAHDGICAESGRKIRAGEDWDLDHALALCNGGQHRESNLQPVLKDPHKAKTARDVAQRAKNGRVRKKHLGIKARKQLIPGSKGSGYRKKMDGTVVRVDE